MALLTGVIALLTAPAAFAGTGNATYQQIYSDLADNGRLDGHYTAAQIAAAADDPTVQGYGLPTVVPPPCVAAQPGQTVTSENAACSPCAAGQVVGGSNGSGGTMCTTPCVPAAAGQPITPENAMCTPVRSTPPGTAPVGQTAGTQVVNVRPTAGVAGTQKTVRRSAAPQASGVAPLSTTKTQGKLPFTGAQLGIFAIVGLILIGGGLLLRSTARGRSDA